jgi:hypothetical protein
LFMSKRSTFLTNRRRWCSLLRAVSPAWCPSADSAVCQVRNPLPHLMPCDLACWSSYMRLSCTGVVPIHDLLWWLIHPWCLFMCTDPNYSKILE